MIDYGEFLAGKRVTAPPSGFAVRESDMNPMLFPFQRHIVRMSLERGKNAILSECGTGKTPMQLECARLAEEHSERPALVATPLAVAKQTVAEGAKFGVSVKYVRNQSEVGRRGVYVTNYDMLRAFRASEFGTIVLDESSILKNFTGATKRYILQEFAGTPYKFPCTATPAPNDHMEIGNHAEFLDAMRSNEMLSRWFINDTMKAGGYRLKRSAVDDFWHWATSWAVALEKPSDIGFDDAGFDLPKLDIVQHTVAVDQSSTTGTLFRNDDLSATSLHREMRLTAPDRARAVAGLVSGSPECWVVWCHTDYEADELRKVLPDALEVRGSEPISAKEDKLEAFSKGLARVIITKPSIAGFGLNWQHCHQMAFVGLSYSYEQLYQALRRSWRYGQKNIVTAHIVTADTEGPVLQAIQRKQRDHEAMKHAMISAMRQHQGGGRLGLQRYQPAMSIQITSWMGEERWAS